MDFTPKALRRLLARMAFCLGALFLLCLAAPLCAAATYYVSPNGNDNNTGAQSAPFLTIQAGIIAAQSGDTVVVGAGTYSGSSNVDIDLDGRNITLIAPSGSANTVIDCGGSSSAIHRGFYLHSGEGANSGALVINGFAVKNGYNNGNNNRGGGGVYIGTSDTVTIQNCRFINCVSTGNGGGIDNEGTLTLTNCTLSSNSSNSSGAGLYNNGTATLTNSTLNSNTSGNGGGVCNNAMLTLTTCTLNGNTGNRDGGALSNYNGTLHATNCIFSGNNAYNNAGLSSARGTVSLSACTITKNISSNSGGGIYSSQDQSLTADRCTDC